MLQRSCSCVKATPCLGNWFKAFFLSLLSADEEVCPSYAIDKYQCNSFFVVCEADNKLQNNLLGKYQEMHLDTGAQSSVSLGLSLSEASK